MHPSSEMKKIVDEFKKTAVAKAMELLKKTIYMKC
jgi:hypothetical protein